jgi:hypothetical protein
MPSREGQFSHLCQVLQRRSHVTSADCITNTFGFGFRQGQVLAAARYVIGTLHYGRLANKPNEPPDVLHRPDCTSLGYPSIEETPRHSWLL